MSMRERRKGEREHECVRARRVSQRERCTAVGESVRDLRAHNHSELS